MIFLFVTVLLAAGHQAQARDVTNKATVQIDKLSANLGAVELQPGIAQFCYTFYYQPDSEDSDVVNDDFTARKVTECSNVTISKKTSVVSLNDVQSSFREWFNWRNWPIDTEIYVSNVSVQIKTRSITGEEIIYSSTVILINSENAVDFKAKTIEVPVARGRG